ncbi:MAG: nucleotidyltransferase family protein [Candidatus Omnitrophica bacterium]|nr:nucleotidyltransferase family protein [Candidatus Omnitrophota bacterium]
MDHDVSALCVDRHRAFGEAIAQMDRNRRGIVLVVDEHEQLVGTITDGDVRRAILSRIDLREPVTALLETKSRTPYARPITAPIGQDPATYLELLTQHRILHLPLLDARQRVAGLATMEQFLQHQPLALHAIVMAGGQGSRLTPLTEDLPKPMLPVGDRPLMEIVIQQLRAAGITRVKVSTHHKPEKIEEHFGDGQAFGVRLSYVAEDRPLGTAGALGLVEVPDETTLVINGDILTQVDFRAMLAYHREHQADLTVAVRHYDVEVPYGVVECEGAMVRRLTEKPVSRLFVNAGIYLLEPSVYRFIPNGERFDMTDLIQRLLDHQRPVASFPIREYWLDIGQHADYQLAQEHAKTLNLAKEAAE